MSSANWLYPVSHHLHSGTQGDKKAFLYIGIYAEKENDTVRSFLMLLPEKDTDQSGYEE